MKKVLQKRSSASYRCLLTATFIVSKILMHEECLSYISSEADLFFKVTRAYAAVVENLGRMPTPQPQKGVPRKKDEATYESLFVRKVMIESIRAKREAVMSPPPRTSKAMIESVEEVCKDIAWGEKREVGRMGLVIQDYICRDLIEEFVKDLGHSYKSSNFYSLPFQACKRKLCF